MLSTDKGTFILLTGLSGSGKTTLGKQIYNYYNNRAYNIIHLDGDEMRETFCDDLGFTPKDRNINIKRIGQVSELLINHGINVVCSVIAPYELHRIYLKKIFKPKYIQIYLDTCLDICKKRDVKGLYAKTKKGEINNMTGILDIYEIPKNNDVTLDTNKFTVGECMYIITNEIGSSLN